MSRYINCKIDGQDKVVWKYVIGIQESEMYRINTELGIGEYHKIRYLDDDETGLGYEYVSEDDFELDVYGLLILNRSDVEKLQMQLQYLKKSDKFTQEDQCFIAMIESIRNFMIEHSEQDQFLLEGEL